MVERGSSFGKRSSGESRASARPIPAGRATSTVNANPHVIYREGETERPTFHNSFLERNWPKFGGAAVAVFMLVYSMSGETVRAPHAMLTALLAGGFSYIFFAGVRRSLNEVHTARTEIFKSRRFAAGAALGFAYFLYAVVFAPAPPTGGGMAEAVARFNDPLASFRDGFQTADFPALGILGAKLAGYMVVGGVALRFLANRIFGQEERIS